MVSKKELRKHISVLKAQFSEEKRLSESNNIIDQILLLPQFQQAKVVMGYHPLPDEVDILPLFQKFLGKKTLLLPVLVGDDIELREYKGEEFLKAGKFNILEPTSLSFYNDYDSIDLVIVPGVAFSKDGNRLGRGRGYYDRFLPKLNRAYKLGVGFSFQIVDYVPTDIYDQPLDCVLTSASDKQ
jgi:5-formyltetrahydrofolate cyclo-ligase